MEKQYFQYEEKQTLPPKYLSKEMTAIVLNWVYLKYIPITCRGNQRSTIKWTEPASKKMQYKNNNINVHITNYGVSKVIFTLISAIKWNEHKIRLLFFFSLIKCQNLALHRISKCSCAGPSSRPTHNTKTKFLYFQSL